MGVWDDFQNTAGTVLGGACRVGEMLFDAGKKKLMQIDNKSKMYESWSNERLLCQYESELKDRRIVEAMAIGCVLKKRGLLDSLNDAVDEYRTWSDEQLEDQYYLARTNGSIVDRAAITRVLAERHK